MNLKAFDLIPVSDSLRGIEGRSVLISSLDMCGANLFIGTTDGTACRYSMAFTDVGFDSRLPTVDKQVASYAVAPGKAIMNLHALSAINRLVALSNDGTLSIHDMWHLEPTKDRLRGLTTMCLNPNPILSSAGDALSAHLCVAKKKQLQLYKLTEERLVHHKDFSAKDNVLALAMEGNTVCYATPSFYFVFDVTSGLHQEVTGYSSETAPPLIKLIQGCEFLVAGPSNLGIFASGDGNATRPPLPFSQAVTSCAYYHPYVLCINEDSVVVYSIFDQEPKQTISFPGGACLDNFEGKLMLCTQDIIFTLHPVPWDQQVTELLKQKKVSEALELAKYAHKTSLTPEEQRDIIARVKQQAGFIQLSDLNFSDAGQLLEEGRADTRAVISLFSVVASERYFVKDPFSTPTIESACGSNPDMRKNAYQFLTNYLEGNRHSVPDEERQAVDTALIKLYALRSKAVEDSDVLTSKLLDMIEDTGTVCDIQECGQFLSDKLKLHHYRAQLNFSQGLHRRGLEIWEKLVSGELVDSTVGDYESLMIDTLKRLSEVDLVVQFAKCVLEKNQSHGARIFIERSRPIDDEVVLSALLKYSIATMEYLEHLVLDRKTKEVAYHTQLANIYLSHVLDPNENAVTPRDYRSKLQTFLKASSFYLPDKILELCTANHLHAERAILYEKLERHEETLLVFVNELGDINAAKDYCQRVSTIHLDHALKCRLYGTLLNILMNPTPNCDSKDEFLEAAISLLNDDDSDFNMDEVLRVVPINWQVTSLVDFITKGLRNSHHRLGMLQIRTALTKLENLHTRQKKIAMESLHFLVRENRVCNVCSRPLLSPSFVRYPDGTLVHCHCFKSQRVMRT